MKYKYLLFDLDGTLWDSREGITKAVAYALEKMGYPVPEQQELSKFIGPPLTEAFPEYCGMTLEEARQGVAYFREYFSEKGIFENTLFPGVKEMLKKLKEDGRVLCTASSKPEVHIETTFRNFGITDNFDYICGGSLDESRCGKPKVIEELLRRIGLTEEEWKTKALMIGDRKYDAEGAALFGIPCLGTSMGFAPEGELEAAGVCGIVHSIEEMTEDILAR